MGRGIDVLLGDEMNGYEAEETVQSVAEIIRVWLLWNDAPDAWVEAALVLLNVELPVAVKIS